MFERNFEQAQLLVTATDPAGASTERSEDLTPRSTFVSSNAAVVSVTSGGRLLGVANGDAVVTVTVDGIAKPVEVHVEGILPEPKTDFAEQVLPILYKAGCNAGTCHASQHGKGGFILSVMGYDPPADRNAVVRDRMQRRVNFLNPARQPDSQEADHDGAARRRSASGSRLDRLQHSLRLDRRRRASNQRPMPAKSRRSS